MTEYILPFSALRQRASPLALVERNVRVSGGDDFAVQVTVYPDEDANSALDLTNFQTNLYLYDTRRVGYGPDSSSFRWADYGFGQSGERRTLPLLIIPGQTNTTASPTLLPLGVAQYVFSPYQTARFHGRYAFTIHLASGAGLGAVIVRGIMEFERGPITLFEMPVFDLDVDSLGGPDVLR